VVAADKEDIDACGLHLRDQRRVLRLTWGVGLIHGHGHAALVQPASDRVGKPRPKHRPVIQDRDLFASPTVAQVIRGLGPLPIVPAADAEHIWAAFVGQLRVDRARGDHQNLGRLIDLRGRDRGV
jgi:hypothetical protein